MTTQELIERIKGSDEKARGEAWQSAGPLGAPAVKPLAEIMFGGEMEAARAARRAVWKIVRYAGRPGAEAERKGVAAEIAPLLAAEGTRNVRRELVWMLSEIGDDSSIPSLSALFTEKELREDARAALQRIPGKKAVAALKSALAAAPADYGPALAVSLRVRGEKVAGYPNEKLVPTKKTEVKQISAI